MFILPINGAKRHEFPINGRPFGPGTSEYGRICVECFDTSSFLFMMSSGVVAVAVVLAGVLLFATSFGNILIADENVVRFTSAFAAVRLPILVIHLISNFWFYPQKNAFFASF